MHANRTARAAGLGLRVFSLVAVLLGFDPALAHAGLVDRGHMTLDMATGLLWLDLTTTVGMTVDEIEAGAGGFDAAGWRVATTDEVCALYGELGTTPTPCPRGIGFFSGGNACQAHLDLLGTTNPPGNSPWSAGWFSDGALAGIGLCAYDGGLNESNVGADVGYPASSPLPNIGVYLVRPGLALQANAPLHVSIEDPLGSTGSQLMRIDQSGLFAVDVTPIPDPVVISDGGVDLVGLTSIAPVLGYSALADATLYWISQRGDVMAFKVNGALAAYPAETFDAPVPVYPESVFDVVAAAGSTGVDALYSLGTALPPDRTDDRLAFPNTVGVLAAGALFRADSPTIEEDCTALSLPAPSSGDFCGGRFAGLSYLPAPTSLFYFFAESDVGPFLTGHLYSHDPTTDETLLVLTDVDLGLTDALDHPASGFTFGSDEAMATAVPEPGVGAMWGCGLLALAALKRRRSPRTRSPRAGRL